MNMEDKKTAWFKKGETLSDKINKGKLHHHVSYVYENPYFKLLRNEVEEFVIEKYGKKYIEKKKIENELTQINRELKRIKRQVTKLEQKRLELLENLNE
jgi:hypothetical protein